MANKWQIGGIQRETKGNRRREKEAKFDFLRKKRTSRLRMCEKNSTFVAYFAVSPIWRAKKREKTAEKHVLKLKIKN
ncbi:MAG: hypothetical protein IJV81_02960 [Paludibacteraceae bacterium]|nr:hypothetical protein [Paludibacteraceae bacterium]